jgi:sulfoxide reductase catalytic subunit YedY
MRDVDMLIRTKPTLKDSDVTTESIYRQRRTIMKWALAAGASAAGGFSSAFAATDYSFEKDWPTYPGPEWLRAPLNAASLNPSYTTKESLTPYPNVITHNNFYEFGLGKQDPSRLGQSFKTDPWTVTVEGEADKTGVYHLEDLIKGSQLEERIYRLRCVEAWSMVIPWIGLPLASLLKRFEPNSKAKFVEFTTLYDPDQMPGQKSRFGTINWPYVEGLTIEEAMHPLAFMATGLYGQALPPQNGAPFRLVVPWKYGFKSIKSIVKIRFTDKMPITSWNQTAPQEYGFYANVNPAVDHPRWSQATERRLPSSLFSPNIIDTLPFNGYAEDVAGLYSGLDLSKWY